MQTKEYLNVSHFCIRSIEFCTKEEETSLALLRLPEFRGDLHRFVTSYMVGRGDKRTNNRTVFPSLKNNAAAGYQGPVKIELLKGAGLLRIPG